MNNKFKFKMKQDFNKKAFKMINIQNNVKIKKIYILIKLIK